MKILGHEAETVATVTIIWRCNTCGEVQPVLHGEYEKRVAVQGEQWCRFEAASRAGHVEVSIVE